MIDSNIILNYIANGREDELDSLYTLGSHNIIIKLGYEWDILDRLQEVFKEPVYIYSFLEDCEKFNIESSMVLDYLDMIYWDEWEEVKKLNLKTQEFDRTKINNREYVNARNLLCLIKKGDFDYYEMTAYDRLESETQKFLIYLLWMEISSARIRAERIEHFAIRTFMETKRRTKAEAINCWKFLQSIN